MTQLARSVAEDLSPIAEQKHIHLWAVSETPTVVVANEDALRLLMTNLCDNALRYTPEGGEIRIETLVRDTEASIRVCDNGPGIPEAERERIFERFYRAEGTKTIPGTGLGLAIVRRVAELHGGKPSISRVSKERASALASTFRSARQRLKISPLPKMNRRHTFLP